MVHGTKVPGNEPSRERMAHKPFVNENESSTMSTRMFHNSSLGVPNDVMLME